MSLFLRWSIAGSLLAAAATTVCAKPAEPAETRAAAIEAQMTDAERLQLVRSTFPRSKAGKPPPPGAIASASFTAPIPRLGVPKLQETDASLGVAWVNGERGDGATPLPSSLSLAASWDPTVAFSGSALIAKQARAKGFNVLLAGGINLAREPRNGRNFEYLGEDPLLAGTLAGESIRAIQSSHMISTIKHFAVNGQETGRHVVNSVISDEAAHDSDLLAFRIAIERGKPGAVMCSYNRYNGPHACQSAYLLQHVLRQEWGYPGFVMSDWGAVRSANDMLQGLDRESGEEFDDRPYFRQDLLSAAQTDPALHARLRDATRRILRSMIASGLFDDPPRLQPIDPSEGAAIARRAGAAGIVLLKNNGVLPLPKTAKTVAVIGGYANLGVLSGGGSSQVQPQAGPAVRLPAGDAYQQIMYHPSAPLAAIGDRLAKDARVRFDQGLYPARAADIARDADIAIVFATQWMTEGRDGDLTLPQGQDALIAAVAAANPHTIVVLETGGPVLMPWLDRAAAVLEAWYPGGSGGEAIADILFGDVNPSGRLPISFPAGLDQLPRPKLDDTPDPARTAGSQSHALAGFDVNYNIEGSDVGYRWYARKQLTPLFPFGFGLSYTQYRYSNIKVTGGRTVSVGFDVTNVGGRPGKDVPQVYVTSRAGTSGIRLIAWDVVELPAGATKHVRVTADPRLLADWSTGRQAWILKPGTYAVAVGASSAKTALTGSTHLDRGVLH